MYNSVEIFDEFSAALCVGGRGCLKNILFQRQRLVEFQIMDCFLHSNLIEMISVDFVIHSMFVMKKWAELYTSPAPLINQYVLPRVCNSSIMHYDLPREFLCVLCLR